MEHMFFPEISRYRAWDVSSAILLLSRHRNWPIVSSWGTKNFVLSNRGSRLSRMQRSTMTGNLLGNLERIVQTSSFLVAKHFLCLKGVTSMDLSKGAMSVWCKGEVMRRWRQWRRSVARPEARSNPVKLREQIRLYTGREEEVSIKRRHRASSESQCAK